MTNDLFGTDGVRGLAGKYPLDQTTVQTIGRAIGLHFSEPGEYILIAHDTRQSSPEIVEALCQGITQMGANVKIVGGLPTPGIAYLTASSDAAAGIMVTASHNPANYNGIKVFARGGKKLTDQQQDQLNDSVVNGVEPRGQGRSQSTPELQKQYEDFLVSSTDGVKFAGLKVAIDMANGAATNIAERVFTRLGASVTPMFDKPDGDNINEACGALHPEVIKKEVVTNSLDLGIALDGDGDRVLLIDKNGEEVKGDYILYILAVAGGYKEVVATAMSNHGFEKALNSHGIKLHRTKVGDRYILEELERSGLSLGGEQSGHIIISNLLATGDGLLAAVQTLKAIKSSGKSLTDWCSEITPLPQATINIDCANKPEDSILEEFSAKETKLLNGGGRVLVRNSGTEPLIRVMVEGANAEQLADAVAQKLQKKLKGNAVASFPTDFAHASTVIQKGLNQKADEAINFLAAKGFVVLDGFTEKLANSVMEIAKQPHIREYCPRDCTPERFESIEYTKQWLGKEHAMFILAKDLGNEHWQAVGYGWTGPKTTPEVPGGETTFALRIGEEGVGQKLAVPFSQVILSATAKLYKGRHMWLETWASNGAGVHTYKKLGFEEVTSKPGRRPTLDGAPVDDMRLFMSLSDELLA